ncbi:hypothetical protein NQ318_001036 [Aromia moschata]|uniref:Uncharacterized protein n=1 Tax=Aromia moschata TaxID=1265417 RepID=A0AAV8ZDZ7_9CUCU|nr:hypothetical protein NQ318_001036 [Aromia moschata]
MLLVFLFIGVFMTNVQFSASHSCQTFDNTEMVLYDKNNKEFRKNVSGCIQRIEFGNATVTMALVKGQSVKQLRRDTVRNMKYLTTVSFVKCETESIAPVAFRNVPSLSKVEISECKLKEIHKDIFTSELTPELNTLVFDNNQINYIEDQSFFNLTKLKNLHVNDNRLEFWRREWFVNATSLELIHFRRNRIKAIPNRAFVSFPKLREIAFDFNEIATIHKDAFKEIRSLEFLGLGHNKLTALEASSFPNTLRVNSLMIVANYLNYLSNGVLQKLTAVDIYMDYNPWMCECLDRIGYWLFIKNGNYKRIHILCKRSDVPICAVSESSRQTCPDIVDLELTRRYIDSLKNLSTPLEAFCAQLEYPS